MLTVVLSLAFIALAALALGTFVQSVAAMVPRLGGLRMAAGQAGASRTFAVSVTEHRAIPASGSVLTMAKRKPRVLLIAPTLRAA